MISLSLTNEDIVYEFTEVKHAVGRIQINSFSETFHASLLLWKREEYLEHWRRSLLSVLESETTSGALITSLAGPDMGFFASWWPIYRLGDDVFIRNSSLFFEDIYLQDRSNMNGWQEYVPARDINVECSEWKIHVEDLQCLLDTLS